MNKQLEELKAAALAATPGPWISGDDSWSDGDNANITTEERNDIGIIDIAQVNGGGSESDLDGSFRTEQQANARYIAEANPAAVLTLLAELEAAEQTLEREREKSRRVMSENHQHTLRIAELGRENSQLKGTLATPVRLPELCGDGENDNEYTEGLNDGINQSAKAIRAAGFAVTVGGDD